METVPPSKPWRQMSNSSISIRYPSGRARSAFEVDFRHPAVGIGPSRPVLHPPDVEVAFGVETAERSFEIIGVPGVAAGDQCRSAVSHPPPPCAHVRASV